MNLEVIPLRTLWSLTVSSRIDGLFSAVPQVCFFCPVFLCATSIQRVWFIRLWNLKIKMSNYPSYDNKSRCFSWNTGISPKRPGVMSWLSAWGLRGQLGAESQLEIRSSPGPSCIGVGWWRCKLDFADEEKCSELMCENEALQKHINSKRLCSSVRLDVISAADWADAIVSTFNDTYRLYAIYW